jgi:hypothetical protein
MAARRERLWSEEIDVWTFYVTSNKKTHARKGQNESSNLSVNVLRCASTLNDRDDLKAYNEILEQKQRTMLGATAIL